MSSDVAIEVRGVGKNYHLYATPRDRLRQLVWGHRKRFYEDFHALRDISFDVAQGETVGIIGRNGSGKSTLLQILCGTLVPTTGRVSARGRIAAMLELGAGFDPEFTGRENVLLNAELLGLTPHQIESRYASICEFADIGDFIEHPVKTYSSGMQVRLAFAVMAHVDADILVIDEALAVGDALFTQKCMRFLRAFKQRGTLLFVTHDTTAVMSLCDRTIWLDRARIQMDGTSKEVCQAYLQFLFESVQGRADAPKPKSSTVATTEGMTAGAPRDVRLDLLNQTRFRNDIRIFEFDAATPSFGRRGARIVAIALETTEGVPLAVAVGGETVALSIVVEAVDAIADPIVGFLVRDRLGQSLFGDNTFLTTQASAVALQPGQRAHARFEFDLPLLPPGDYSINAAIAEGTQHEHIQHEWMHDALLFRVETSSIRHSLVGIPMRRVEMRRL